MNLTMSRHAEERMVEFGLSPDVISAIATRPDVSHTNRSGESVRVCDAHPSWTVVVGADGTVITVLRRTAERWEHEISNGSPRPVHSIEARLPAAEAIEADPYVAPLRAASGRRRPASAPMRASVVSTRVVVDPAALELARQLAGGDLRRLVLNLDGSVTVLNRARGK